MNREGGRHGRLQRAGSHHGRRGLLGFAWFLARLIKNKPIDSEGWAGFFGVTGLPLLGLGLHTTVAWPFGADGLDYANIAFGQPAAGFGALLPFAAVYLWRHRALFTGDVAEDNASALAALKPIHLRRRTGSRHGGPGHHVRPLPAGRGPAAEPISGRFGHLPILEALFLGGLWGVVALGALWFAIALLTDRQRLLRWAIWAWVIGGVVFLLFGDELLHPHRDVLQHRARDHAQVVTRLR